MIARISKLTRKPPTRSNIVSGHAKIPLSISGSPLNSVVSRTPTFLDPEQRTAMIAEAAYYRAEHRGFESGYELEDWLAAEREIDSTLTSRESAVS